MSRHLPTIKLTTTDVSLVFGLPILAYSEWRFGTEVLGLPQIHLLGLKLSLALFVPGFLDTYVVAAMRRGGSEVVYALGLVVMSVTGGAVAHLYQLQPDMKVLASAVFGLMLAVVIWRVKTIAHADSPAAAAAKAAAAQVEDLTATLTQADTQIHELTTQLTTAQRAGQDAAAAHTATTGEVAELLRQHERDLSDAEHRHELAVTKLRAQLDAARAATRGPGNVVPLRPRATPDEEAEETRQASDQELLDVLAPMVKANPAVGRPAATAAVRQAGLACGTARMGELLTRAKTDHQHARAETGPDRLQDPADDTGADVAVSS